MSNNQKDTSSSDEKTGESPMNLDSLMNLGGVLGGFSNILQQIGNLAEKGEQLKRASQSDNSDSSKKVAGSFGYTVKFGGESFSGSRQSDGFEKTDSITPITPVRKANPATATSRPVQSVREPIVETFDESDYFVVIAEMPGVSKENIELNIHEKTLTLLGQSSINRYEKSIDLPRSVKKEGVSIITNNGVVEIRLNYEE